MRGYALSCSESAETSAKPCNLVLVGFMACGKTTIGKALAQALNFGFIDTDALIEEAAGCSIPDIFAAEGEAGFRRRERGALERCRPVRRQVIATGGGVVTQDGNRALLPQLGFVVWLQADPTATLERARRNPHRPLLQVANPAARIAELLAQREPWYREVADLVLPTEGLLPREAVCGIVDSACVFFSKHCGRGGGN